MHSGRFGARGRGVSWRLRRKQAFQFRSSLSARAGPRKALARNRHAAHRLPTADRDRYAFEWKTPGFDKGKAIATSLSCPLFRGRTPIYVSDDETDEAGFAVVSTLGGFAFRWPVARASRLARPSGARQWLADFAESGDGA
jgi:trehalose-6-phosphatase